MGLDLSLLPVDHYTPEWGYSHSILQVPRDSDLFQRIHIKGIAVPRDFSTYMGPLGNGERGYGNTQVTPYGEPLELVKASDLKPLGFSGPVGDYLQALPDDKLIALFWH